MNEYTVETLRKVASSKWKWLQTRFTLWYGTAKLIAGVRLRNSFTLFFRQPVILGDGRCSPAVPFGVLSSHSKLKKNGCSSHEGWSGGGRVEIGAPHQNNQQHNIQKQLCTLQQQWATLCLLFFDIIVGNEDYFPSIILCWGWTAYFGLSRRREAASAASSLKQNVAYHYFLLLETWMTKRSSLYYRFLLKIMITINLWL